jgi:hypothetical protein
MYHSGQSSAGAMRRRVLKLTLQYKVICVKATEVRNRRVIVELLHARDLAIRRSSSYHPIRVE